MAKRKSGQIEQDEEDFVEEDDELTGSGSEGGGSDLSGSGEEEEGNEKEALHEEFSAEEDEDGSKASDVDSAEEEKEEYDNSAPSTAFGRAFGKIMKRSVPQSTFTDLLGPVLAERKQLLIRKLKEEETEGKEKISRKDEKREMREKGHVLPQSYTDAKEKGLIKLATKGVVRLFNAVSKAQKVQADADLSSSKAAKASWKQSKSAFMTELRATSQSRPRANLAHGTPGVVEPQGTKEEIGWAALKSDFMLGTSKLKDWDKSLADSATES